MNFNLFSDVDQLNTTTKIGINLDHVQSFKVVRYLPKETERQIKDQISTEIRELSINYPNRLVPDRETLRIKRSQEQQIDACELVFQDGRYQYVRVEELERALGLKIKN